MGVRVYRNNTTRKDAVYVVRARFDGENYRVTGHWGKWKDFLTVNYQALQSKDYYTGPSLQIARAEVANLMNERIAHGYFLVTEYSEPFPWETSAPVTPKPSTPSPSPSPAIIKVTPKAKPKAKPAQADDDPQPTRRFTRGGLLEFD